MPFLSESSLCAQWVAKDPSFRYADSEDSDQTGRMPRLIWVFAGRTVTLLVLSWGGSYLVIKFDAAYLELQQNFCKSDNWLFGLSWLYYLQSTRVIKK